MPVPVMPSSRIDMAEAVLVLIQASAVKDVPPVARAMSDIARKSSVPSKSTACPAAVAPRTSGA